MITLEPLVSLVKNFASMESLLATYGPESLQARRKNRLARFEAVGLPTTRDEEFKYLPLHELTESNFAPAYGATVYEGDLEAHPLRSLEGITLTFVNGEYAPELSNVSGLPNGARVMSLREALEQHEGLVLRHLGNVAHFDNRLGSTNDLRFVDLNDAFLSEGAFVFVSRGTVVETPIHLRFVNRADHGAFVAHPRLLIHVEENAQAKIVESHVGLDANPYFINAVTEIVVEANAILEHTKFQDESPAAIHLANIFATQGTQSTWTSNNVSFGASKSRNDVNVYVGGEHVETALNGTYVGRNKQIHDSHTRIDHALPNCHSFEVYKGILDDQSVGVFNGKIFVYEDAQKTDAKQTNQALLLSPTATINTKPQLEIFADDVKCTHGATVGQIREDALFYLRARGVPELQARNLLVYAFIAEVLEKISVEEVRDALENTLFDKLSLAESA
jgi:Fe-S cluster assembly protein SufD